MPGQKKKRLDEFLDVGKSLVLVFGLCVRIWSLSQAWSSPELSLMGGRYGVAAQATFIERLRGVWNIDS